MYQGHHWPELEEDAGVTVGAGDSTSGDVHCFDAVTGWTSSRDKGNVEVVDESLRRKLDEAIEAIPVVFKIRARYDQIPDYPKRLFVFGGETGSVS